MEKKPGSIPPGFTVFPKPAPGSREDLLRLLEEGLDARGLEDWFFWCVDFEIYSRHRPS